MTVKAPPWDTKGHPTAPYAMLLVPLSEIEHEIVEAEYGTRVDLATEDADNLTCSIVTAQWQGPEDGGAGLYYVFALDADGFATARDRVVTTDPETQESSVTQHPAYVWAYTTAQRWLEAHNPTTTTVVYSDEV